MSHDRGSGRLAGRSGLGFRGGLAGLARARGAVRGRLRGVSAARRLMAVARDLVATVAIVAIVTIEPRLDWAIDRRQPVHVLRAHATHDLGVDALNLARHWANLAGPDRPVIHLDNRGDLRASAGEEDLVGDVEFR